jgi:uncharacterized C2H2 Zn-finger protein
MTINKRKRCPECGFLGAIKWGVQNGHQRYKCKNCGSYFTSTKPYRKSLNLMVWFERWVLGKQTIKQLSQQSGYSEKSLRLWFDKYLKNYPQWEISRREKVNLMIDGTYFANKVCLVLYRDNRVKATLLYRLTDGEWEQEINEDLQNLLDIGIEIESVTCDGINSIIRSVKKASKIIVLQRCIVHVQRECLIWLTKHPKSEAGVELRKIVSQIHTIKNREQWGYWVVSLVRWEQEYRAYLNQKTFKEDTNRYWFTHKMVRRSFVHIRRALPNMFHYLDNPNIPSNTNSLESFFGHLKQNISLHRGLSKTHYQNYVKWYLYFRNKDNKQAKK